MFLGILAGQHYTTLRLLGTAIHGNRKDDFSLAISEGLFFNLLPRKALLHEKGAGIKICHGFLLTPGKIWWFFIESVCLSIRHT